MTHLDTTHPRFIVCAALCNETGQIICGVRHFDPLMHAQINARADKSTWKGADQGFIDNYGKFLTREEAWKMAKEKEQIRFRCGGDGKKLFSENLY